MATESEALRRARALAPEIGAHAERIDAERRLPEPLLTALHEAGLFRLLLPRTLDGAELDPVTFVRVIEEVAEADASTAWCVCQAAGCAMAAAYLTPAAAREIFGDARAVLAWGPGPEARAVTVDGGYRISGTWRFASGIRHATWLGGYCPILAPDGTPRRRADGSPEGRTMLFPAARATRHDVWRVVGLRGTGSDSFSVAGLFVPQAHSVARDDPAERVEAGPLYRLSSLSLYASGFAGVALGIARATLRALVDLARDKTPYKLTQPLRENAVVQSQVARAEARLRAARLFLQSSLEDVWRELGCPDRPTVAQRVLIRLAATHAIHEAREVVDTMYHAAGATAIFAEHPFERRLRDMHALTQQLQGRQAHFETAGRFLLGLDPDTSSL